MQPNETVDQLLDARERPLGRFRKNGVFAHGHFPEQLTEASMNGVAPSYTAVSCGDAGVAQKAAPFCAPYCASLEELSKFRIAKRQEPLNSREKKRLFGRR